MIKIENVRFEASSKEEYAARTREYSNQLREIQTKLATVTGNVTVASPLRYVDGITGGITADKVCVPELDSFVSPNLIMIGVLRSKAGAMIGVRLYDYALSCISDYSVESVIARIREGTDRILNLDVLINGSGNPELICTMNTFNEYIQLDDSGNPVSDYHPLTYIGGYDTGLFVDYTGKLIRISMPMSALFLAISSGSWEYAYNYNCIKAILIDLLTVGVSNLVLGCISSNVNFTGILEPAANCHVFETGYSAYYFRSKAPIYQMDLESVLRFCDSPGVGTKGAITYKVFCPWYCLYRSAVKSDAKYDMTFRPVAFSFGYRADVFKLCDSYGRYMQSFSPATFNKGDFSRLRSKLKVDYTKTDSARRSYEYSDEKSMSVNLHNSWELKMPEANGTEVSSQYAGFPGFSFLFERNHYPVVTLDGISNFVRLNNAPDVTTPNGVLWDVAGLSANLANPDVWNIPDEYKNTVDSLTDFLSPADLAALKEYCKNLVWIEQVKYSSIGESNLSEFAEPARLGLVTLYRANPLLGTAEDNFALGNAFLPQELVSGMADVTLSSIVRSMGGSEFKQQFGCFPNFASKKYTSNIRGTSLSAASPVSLSLEAVNPNVTLYSANLNDLPMMLHLELRNNSVKTLEVRGNSFLFEILYIDGDSDADVYALDKLILNSTSTFPELCYGSSVGYVPGSDSSWCSSCIETRVLEFKGNVEIITPQFLDRLMHFCTKPEELILCEGIMRIGYRAFADNQFKELKLPTTLKYLDVACFARSSRLKTLDIPNGVLEIGAEAFSSCSMLESVHIPASVQAIHRNAFANCVRLKNLVIDGAPYIEDFAFAGDIPSILQRTEAYRHFSDGSRTGSPVRRFW